MAQTIEPLAPDELEALFAPYFARRGTERFVLAVSGGSDSTALLVLLAEWLTQRELPRQAFSVATIDHGLRAESAAEAEAVGRQAAGLGFAHAVLAWQGDKPTSGLQAAARAARYRLLADHARAQGATTIVTAHTADDQAETLLMRLARGSGLDGLSGIAPDSALHEPGPPERLPLRLVRPLLDVTKARLQASLRARGIAWIEDPSNASLRFERARLRAAQAELDKLGLTAPMLALSARRLQLARTALESWVADLLEPDTGAVHIDPCGFFSIDRSRLRGVPREVTARLLVRAVGAAGGSAEPVPLAGLEALVHELLRTPAGAWTLARAKVTATADRILVEREPGREALPALTLLPGQSVYWDGRFRVAVDAACDRSFEVRDLGVDGVREVRARVDLPPDLPALSLRAVPGFWDGTDLMAVPTLGVWAEPRWRTQLDAEFLPNLRDVRSEP